MLLLVKSETTSIRRRQLAWIGAILEFKQWNPTRLAREAEISQSTIAKFLNDPTNEVKLGTNTVEKIARASSFRPYELSPSLAPRAFSEREAEPFEGYEGQSHLNRLVEQLARDANGLTAWTLNSRVLELAGYLPGDVLVVDLNAEPQDGDVVCAQIYDRGGDAETVFRLYQRPYLIASTLSRTHLKPILVDNDLVAIRGVVTSSHRPRLTLIAS